MKQEMNDGLPLEELNSENPAIGVKGHIWSLTLICLVSIDKNLR